MTVLNGSSHAFLIDYDVSYRYCVHYKKKHIFINIIRRQFNNLRILNPYYYYSIPNSHLVGSYCKALLKYEEILKDNDKPEIVLIVYGAGSLYSTIKKWHLNIFRHLKKSRYRKNKPVTLFSKTCSIELPASFLIYTLLKKLLAFKIALFLYDRPIFETHKITCTF